MGPFERVVELETRRADAWIKRDKDALRGLLSEDYVEINIFGRFSKDDVLNRLFESHELLEYKMSECEFLEMGATACGLTYRVSERLKTGDQIASFTCYVTAIYKLQNGIWSLLLWQITPYQG